VKYSSNICSEKVLLGHNSDMMYSSAVTAGVLLCHNIANLSDDNIVMSS
jgi:hypothetical protein